MLFSVNRIGRVDLQTTLTGVAALAAVASSVAAWRANAHAKRSDRSVRAATLLSRLPLPVPWVDNPQTMLRVVNRGASTAHNLRWAIIIDGKEEAVGDYTRVLNPGSSASLTDPQHAIVTRVAVAHEFVVSCGFSTSWGETFSVRRTYIDGKSQGPVLLDGAGERVTLLDP